MFGEKTFLNSFFIEHLQDCIYFMILWLFLLLLTLCIERIQSNIVLHFPNPLNANPIKWSNSSNSSATTHDKINTKIS